MSSPESEIDIQLELKDRINYPHILQVTLLNLKRAIAKDDIDLDKLENMMWDFFTDIPHSWYDEDFINDVKKSIITRKVDNRPVWGGQKLSLKKCEELGLSIKKTLVGINIFLLKNAIVNLLHRRDMLVRKKKIEYSTGNNLKFQTLDDLAEYEDENGEDEEE
ncbi:MAG: hypothetical protein GF317_12030 [Candidatus Lokiarchaeota archaeon]|nr:hypothetical protein [Candidatus Lokiarchaeota archaeon]